MEYMEYKIKINKNKNLKNLSIRLDLINNQVILNIPKNISDKKAYEFLHSKEKWIETHITKNQKYTNETSLKIENNSKISFIGKTYIVEHCPQEKGGVWIKENKIYVTGDIEFLERRIKDFLKKEFQKYLNTETKKYAKIINKKISKIRITNTKSRWGSCSSDKILSFSWKLCFAPIFVIQYLIAHETAHLKEMNHSKKFWNLVDEILLCIEGFEHTKEFAKLWLKKYGNSLHYI